MKLSERIKLVDLELRNARGTGDESAVIFFSGVLQKLLKARELWLLPGHQAEAMRLEEEVNHLLYGVININKSNE